MSNKIAKTPRVAILNIKALVLSAAPLWMFLLVVPAYGTDLSSGASSDSSDTPQLNEVVVTARKREENLQDVPDAITAFTAASIENAGIRHISDFFALTPNLTFEDGSDYRSGYFNLSMRGIGNSQGGWPSVAYIIDGVPADSTDSINSGSLEDIERIEVLRGPQSALYGANAIAGAINIVTRRPTNDFQFSSRLSYGNGEDRQFGATVSGPIIPDTLLFRVTATYRDDNGLMRSSTNGLDLDFRDQKQVQGRLIFTPVEKLEVDIHGSFTKEHNGANYEDEVPDISYIDNFNPLYNARRGFAGTDDRELYRIAARISYDFGPVALTSVTGYSHVDQQQNSSFCFDDPSKPLYPGPDGAAQCLLGPALGNSALPGEARDEFASGPNNFRTWTQDIRLATPADRPINAIVGATAMQRKYLEGSDYGNIVAPDNARVLLSSQYDEVRDTWWGLYGQISAKLTQALELTFAGRYDDDKDQNTNFTDGSLSTVVPAIASNGALLFEQTYRSTSFQPKGQVSYRFNEDFMGYVTVSRGFRAGFWTIGTYTVPEHTTNYEVGLKSSLWDRRATLNLAAFHIDYSDQQYTTFTNEFPYAFATTIPKTRINGAELETVAQLTRLFNVGVGIGYLDAMVSDGTRSPGTPRFNANVTADFGLPVSNRWTLRAHADDRFNSALYLAIDNMQEIPSKNYLNLRLGVDDGRYSFNLFMKNATDTRQSTAPGAELVAGFLRYQNEPRSYGGEIRVTL
jgi:iron complex outermembrane receptor protein